MDPSPSLPQRKKKHPKKRGDSGGTKKRERERGGEKDRDSGKKIQGRKSEAERKKYGTGGRRTKKNYREGARQNKIKHRQKKTERGTLPPLLS